MSYQALYRVWRPKRFDDVIGQQTIIKTLKNSLMMMQTSHAYLFTGPRGTGKTSTAKILAKALNCQFIKNGEPCNQCSICKSIDNGTLNDVIEIDAASNNGVDEIRNIRDKVKYAPSKAKYKVYIIDEVHMLSIGAFNALLKTLEEPPMNVVFILATTDPYKIPATIISRTQRFDFRRISAEDIYNRLCFILNKENIPFEQNAIKIIAKIADGGMRDALTILDQVISFSNKNIMLNDVLEVTGELSKELLNKYMISIQSNEVSNALESIQLVLDNGKDEKKFIEDIIDYCHNLLLYQQSPHLINEFNQSLLDNDFKDLSTKFDFDTLYKMIDILNQTQQQIRFSSNPSVYLEIMTIKMARINIENKDKTIYKKVEYLEKKISKLSSNLNKLNIKKNLKSNDNFDSSLNFSIIKDILSNATKYDKAQVLDIWDDILSKLQPLQRSLLEQGKVVAASKKSIIVSFNTEMPIYVQQAKQNIILREELFNSLKEKLNREFKIVFITNDEWMKLRTKYLCEYKKDLSNLKSNSVSKAKELFGNNVTIKDD